MDARLMRYFAAVADEGTVSAAASELGITQPALSRQIRLLERQTGLKLFSRAGVRLALTAEGQEFLSVSRDVLQKLDHAQQVAERLVSGRLSTVSLAAPRTTLIDVVAPFVATFQETDPVPSITEIAVNQNPARLVPTVDLVVTPRRPVTEVARLPLANLPVYAYVPPEHRWAGRKTVTIQELADEPLLLPSPEFQARHLLDSALILAGLSPSRVVETAHGRVAQALAAAGRGVAVLSDDPRFGLRAVRVEAPGGDLLRVQLHAAWRRDHHAAETLEDIARRLQSFSRERYGETLRSGRTHEVLAGQAGGAMTAADDAAAPPHPGERV